MSKVNEYDKVNQEMDEILDNRKNITNQQQQWNYNKQVGKTLHTQPFKYQAFEMSGKVQFTPDMRKLIYDQNAFPQDLKIFTSSDWQLAPVTQSTLEPPAFIPSITYIRSKKTNTKDIDMHFGYFEFEGRLKGKANQIHYNTYYFNLRSNVISCYTNNSVEAGEKQLFYVFLNQTTYDYRSDAGQFMLLRSDQKNLKILKDELSRELIDRLEKKLLKYAFRGAYALRNQVPTSKLQHYIQEEIDVIGPIRFHEESSIKDITNMKYYRQSIGAFFKLLQINSLKRRNRAGQIMYPRWLKEQFRDMPVMQMGLSTNVIPPQTPLMSLKIKVNQNQKQGLYHCLKYIFPYRKAYLKRTLVVYQSELIDKQLSKLLNNLSYPMNLLGFPNNNLTIDALYTCINKSSDFYNEIIDLSFNTKLSSISGGKSMNLLNNNPTIKKLILRGCQISNEDPNTFFDALASNLCMQEIIVNYNNAYNQGMVEYLSEFQAVIYYGNQ